MIEHFKNIGHVEIDGERMRLVGDAPKINGVYAWVFDGEVRYIGVAKRAKGGLDQRLRSYLRRRKDLNYSSRKDGKPGTTSVMRTRIREHIENSGCVTVIVATEAEIPGGDVTNFELLAIQSLRPIYNIKHR